MSRSTHTVHTTTCDVCGHAVEGCPEWFLMVTPHDRTQDGDESDVCPECHVAIIQFIEGRSKS